MIMTQNPTPTMRDTKTELFDQFARVGKALSSGLRIEILDLLGQSERSVETLAEMLGQSIQNISRHLQVLRQTKLIASRKDGNFVIYRLADEGVRRLVSVVQGVAQQHLSEVDEILERFEFHQAEFESLDAAELMRRANAGEVLVLDVRPKAEFNAGHLPGAVNLPLSELARRLEELPKDVEVVAYCRGKYCLLAYAAVDYLMSRGHAASRLSMGFSEWKLEARPLVVNAEPAADISRSRAKNKG